MIIRSCRLPEHIDAWLLARAKIEHRTVGNMLVCLVIDAMEKEGMSPTVTSADAQTLRPPDGHTQRRET